MCFMHVFQLRCVCALVLHLQTGQGVCDVLLPNTLFICNNLFLQQFSESCTNILQSKNSLNPFTPHYLPAPVPDLRVCPPIRFPRR